MKLRDKLVRFHRYVGLAMAGYLVIAGLTGSVLVFDREIDRALNADLLVVSPSTQTLPVGALINQALTYAPDAAITMISLPETKTDPFVVHVRQMALANDKTPFTAIYVDPGNGTVLGARDAERGAISQRGIVRFLYILHYSLHGGGIARLLLGFVALAWFVDCFVGAWLTLPRGHPFWRKWAMSWRIKRDAGSYRRKLDLHRAGGLWLWGMLALIAFSGAFLNLKSILFNPLLRAASWAEPSPLEALPASSMPGGPHIDYATAYRLADRDASSRGATGRVFYVWFGEQWNIFEAGYKPSSPAGVVSRLYLDGSTGDIIQSTPFAHALPGDKLAALQLPLHSGEIAGMPGRLLICLSGLVVAMLSITGVSIWWRKRGAGSRRQRSPKRLVMTDRQARQ
ncbi:MAG: hypothetical protein BGO57_14930 [Sphingomonadales bacterium 63-6]|nr:MAG: hypothetical protein BGO57_14930 [Sphingomonadales bacterium 63-6]